LKLALGLIKPDSGSNKRFSKPVSDRSTLKHIGAVAFELAVCAPFVFLMVVGLLELSHMAQVQQILSNAAREGARLSA
jgi:Flp pilus assembly protein TadG